MRIGVDIDGVLFPFDDVARDVLRYRFGGVSLEPSNSWSALKDEVSGKAWRWLWSPEGKHHVFGRITHAYTNAVKAVNCLMQMGHEVHFVTHRDPATTLVYTAEFLEQWFGMYRWAGVHSIRGTTAKADLAHWDVFVDDKPSIVLQMLEREQTQVFAPWRPWNAAELENTEGLVMYHDPAVIVDWVAERCGVTTSVSEHDG